MSEHRLYVGKQQKVNGVRNMKLKIVSILIIIMSIFSIVAPVYAMPTFDEMKSQADSWLERGEQGVKLTPAQIAEIIKPISQILAGIGTITLIVVAIVMGIKYVSASPDEQAKLKTQLIGLVVAAIVIFGAYGIWSIVYNFMTEIT